MYPHAARLGLSAICLASVVACGGGADKPQPDSSLTPPLVPAPTPTASPQILQFDVAHYLIPCDLLGYKTQCVALRKNSSEDYQPRFGGVEGFTHEWRRAYRIEVSKINDNLPDGTQYKLLRVLSEELQPQDIQFTNTVEKQFVVQKPDGSRELLLQTPFVCETPQICADLDKAFLSANLLKLTFGYSSGASALPLVLKAVAL
jgi:hypothetical protein